MDGEIISKFKKAENDGVEYAVTLLVAKNDVSYDEYSKEKVVYLLFITTNLPVFTVDVTPASVMYALTIYTPVDKG